MPASNRITPIDWRDYLNDFRNYYQSCVVTHVPSGRPMLVLDSYQDNSGQACANVRPVVKTGIVSKWGAPIAVPIDELSLAVPEMGIFKLGTMVVLHLSRKPVRTMVKGYCDALVQMEVIAGGEAAFAFHPTHPMVVEAVWGRLAGGKSTLLDKINILDGMVTYLGFPVAKIDENGNGLPIEGQEKLGEITCKLLAKVSGSGNFLNLLPATKK